jgi:hypothetical protein
MLTGLGADGTHATFVAPALARNLRSKHAPPAEQQD